MKVIFTNLAISGKVMIYQTKKEAEARERGGCSNDTSGKPRDMK